MKTEFSPTVIEAALEYIARRDRTSHPAGSFDKAGRFEPDAREYQGCCIHVRAPSRAWPYSLMVHCRTAEHVARRYGVNCAVLLAAARSIESQEVRDV